MTESFSLTQCGSGTGTVISTILRIRLTSRTLETHAQSGKPPTIPGADFANNIASAVENTSNGIVVNLEKFANSILPFSPGKASNEPAHADADLRLCLCDMRLCMCVRVLCLRLCRRRSGHQRRWSETMSALKRIFRPPKIPQGRIHLPWKRQSGWVSTAASR